MEPQTITQPGTLNMPGIDPRLLGGGAGGGAGGNIPYNNLTSQQKLNILFGRS